MIIHLLVHYDASVNAPMIAEKIKKISNGNHKYVLISVE